MSQADQLLHRLKRELKTRGITYARVAHAIGVSEATIKRLFSRGDLSLGRLEAICDMAGISITDLARGIDPEDRLLTALTDDQERALVADPILFMTATSVLNLMDFEQILAHYDVTAARLVAAFVALDRIGFIRLLPNNRYRLLIARAFRWLPDGPIQRTFKAHANAYFDSAFDGPGEFMVLLNARLTKAHAAALIDRLQRLAREVSEQHMDDARARSGERPSLSLLLAVRPWQPGFLRDMERPPAVPSRRIRRR